MSGTNVNIGQITVNVNDTIPPDNYATVDAGTKVGTVYTKEQDNAWRKEVEDKTSSGIKGIAKPDDTIVTTGFYRMLVEDSDTYTNYLDVLNAPIVVLPSDFNIVNGVYKNEVFIDVNNGVSTKKVYAKVGENGANGTAEIPNYDATLSYVEKSTVIKNSSIYRVADGQTAAIGEIPGESNKWLVLGSNLADSFDKNNEDEAVSAFEVSGYIGDFPEEYTTTEEFKSFPNSWVNGTVMYNGALTPSANTRHIKIDVLQGDTVVFKGRHIAQGVSSIVFVNSSGSYTNIISSGDTSIYLYEALATGNGSFYINQSTNASDVEFLYKITITQSTEPANLVDYIDGKFKVRTSNAYVNVPLDVVVSDYFFNVNQSGIGTSYRTLSAAAGLRVSRLYPVKIGDRFLYTGRVGWNGVALFDNQGLLSEKILFNPSGAYVTDYPIEIDSDGFLQISFDINFTNTLRRLSNDAEEITMQEIYDALPNTSSGLSFAKTFVFAENHGVSAENTATANTVSLNALFNEHKGKGSRIILPNGKIKINGMLSLPNDITLEGAGWGSDNVGGTTLFAESSTACLYQYQSAPTEYQSGKVSNIKFDGNNISERGLVIGTAVVNGNYENLVFKWFTDICLFIQGGLILSFKNCRFANSPNGTRLRKNGDFQPNQIKFDSCQWIILSGIGSDIANCANIVHDFCDFEHIGTAGDMNTGVIKAVSMSPTGEGKDLVFNNCWSEVIHGGFWLNISGSAGVTSFHDTMVWSLSDAVNGIVNNGCKVLLDGGTRIKGFPNSLVTSNGGITRIAGFASTDNHTESTGGVIQNVQYS